MPKVRRGDPAAPIASASRHQALPAMQSGFGGDFKTYAVPENTGKPGSLKKNYGSWKVVRKLRPITPKDAK